MKNTKEKIKRELYRLYARSVTNDEKAPDTLEFLYSLTKEIEDMIDVLEKDIMKGVYYDYNTSKDSEDLDMEP